MLEFSSTVLSTPSLYLVLLCHACKLNCFIWYMCLPNFATSCSKSSEMPPTLFLFLGITLPLHACCCCAFSALTLLVGQQEGHPACKKTEWWGAGAVICLEQSADLHTAQLMPLPLTVSCFSKIQIGFTFLVPAHLGSPRKGPLNGCVCVHTCCCMLCGYCQHAGLVYVFPRESTTSCS